MDAQVFAEWFSGLSLTARISALSRIYLRLTVNARELFAPDWTAGKEHRVEEILHGLNEIHHTLANQLTAYTTGSDKASPVQTLSGTLQDRSKPKCDIASDSVSRWRSCRRQHSDKGSHRTRE